MYISQFSGSGSIFIFSRIQFTRSPQKLAQYCGRFTFTFSFFPPKIRLVSLNQSSRVQLSLFVGLYFFFICLLLLVFYVSWLSFVYIEPGNMKNRKQTNKTLPKGEWENILVLISFMRLRLLKGIPVRNSSFQNTDVELLSHQREESLFSRQSVFTCPHCPIVHISHRENEKEIM